MAVVLVIEDNDMIRSVVQRMLCRAGHDVLEAPDAIVGLALARQHHPSVIVMDLTLPVMDGFTAIAQLKHSAATSNIPVIAISGHGDSVEQHARQQGCDDFLMKPFAMQQFLACVNAFVDPATRQPTRRYV